MSIHLFDLIVYMCLSALSLFVCTKESELFVAAQIAFCTSTLRSCTVSITLTASHASSWIMFRNKVMQVVFPPMVFKGERRGDHKSRGRITIVILLSRSTTSQLFLAVYPRNIYTQDIGHHRTLLLLLLLPSFIFFHYFYIP